MVVVVDVVVEVEVVEVVTDSVGQGRLGSVVVVAGTVDVVEDVVVGARVVAGPVDVVAASVVVGRFRVVGTAYGSCVRFTPISPGPSSWPHRQPQNRQAAKTTKVSLIGIH